MAGATVRCFRIAAAAVVIATTLPRPALAQSWGLGWLKAAEEWSMKEDYRGWIFHGAIAALVTLTADWVAGKPEYGAAIGSGFYIGKEIRELFLWNAPTVDVVMDLATPVATSTLTAWLLTRNRPKPLPKLLPAPFADPCGGAGRPTEPGIAPAPSGCLAVRLQLQTPGATVVPPDVDVAARLCGVPPRRLVACADS